MELILKLDVYVPVCGHVLVNVACPHLCVCVCVCVCRQSILMKPLNKLCGEQVLNLGQQLASINTALCVCDVF